MSVHRSAALRFFCLLALLFVARPAAAQTAPDAETAYAVGPAPGWIVPQATDFDAAPPKDQAGGGLYYLLLDDQARVDGAAQAVYSRYVLKVLGDEGASEASQFSIDFDPHYQRLTLHDVVVHRSGTRHDRLRRENISLLQRETGLEQQIYDGRQTLNVILEDLRVGDVVEYSYTLAGANPVFDGRYATRFRTSFSAPVDCFRYRLRWPVGRTLHVKAHGDAPAPMTTREGDTVVYEWTRRRPDAALSDGDVPAWYAPYDWVQLSEWGTWEDVAAWAEPMYAPQTSAAVRTQAAALAAQDSTAAGQLISALRFVQDEVRYLGFEMGRGSHEPRPPATVLKRRFGDCKDKARLLVSLLDALGIEAHAALVHTRWEDTLTAWLPTPFAFNHVIVTAVVEGQRYWIDPTKSHQRGTLAYLHQPDFGQALVIRPGTTALTAMDPAQPDHLDKEIQETFNLTDGVDAPAQYAVRTIHYGAEADAMRGYLAETSRQQVAKDYLNYYAATYPGIEVHDTLAVYDDEDLNRLIVQERYAIADFWAHDEAEGAVTAAFHPTETRDLLYRPSTAIRTMPLAVRHPFHQRHTFEVLPPGPWPIENETTHIENEALAFDAQVAASDGGPITLTYDYRTKADHVAPEATGDYLEDIEAISENLGYQLYRYNDGPGGFAGLNWSLLLLALLTLSIAAYFARNAYYYEPAGSPPAPEERDPRYVGLRGWLVLVGLGVVIRPLTLLATGLFVLSQADATRWGLITNPASAVYDPLWAPTILFEIVANSALLPFAVLVAVFFFKRRVAFPRVFSVFLAVFAVVLVIDTALTASIPGADPGYVDTARNAISSLIWIAYCYTSKRVASTFVRRRSSTKAEARGLLPEHASAVPAAS